VVATGIDQSTIARTAAAAPAAKPISPTPPTTDTRIADLSAKLREDQKRQAALAAAQAQKAAEQPRPVAHAAPAAQPATSGATVERAALEAIAAAVAEPMQPAAPAPVQPASYGDVTVRPIAQKPTLFPDHDPAPRENQESPPPENFIPQPAERAPVRAPRMPRIEELPMPAQNEIRQARGEADGEHPQKSRLSLLQRLANVSLGRRDQDTEPPIAARASGPAMAPMPPLPERRPQRSVAEQMATNEPVSEYARRPAPQGLDSHGRPAPVAPAPQGDDHLDIPAFLRRQAN
jgi:cell division protein FtsZ